MKYTEQEKKFLELLGYRLPIIQWYNDDYLSLAESALLEKSPDMFLALWKSCLQFRYYCRCHFEKGKKEKLAVNQTYFNMCADVCCESSGKTFDELLEIWEDCACSD